MKVFFLLALIMTGCATTSSVQELDKKLEDKFAKTFDNLHKLNVDSCAIRGYICLDVLERRKEDVSVCEQQYIACRQSMDELFLKNTGKEFQYPTK